MGESKILNSNYRIKKLIKREKLENNWAQRGVEKLNEQIENNKDEQIEKKQKKEERKKYRKSISHISKYLAEQIPPYVKIGCSARIGTIRKFLVDKNLVEKKDKMTITEENVVDKWLELVGDVEETESEDGEEF